MEEEGERSSFVIAMIENRAKEVGVAAFDLRSAALHLSQYIETSISYQNTKTLLNFYEPMVVIVPPNKLAADGMVGVSTLVDKYCESSRKVVLARGCFDDTKGAMLVKNLAAAEPSALGLDTYYKQYYLCLAAAAAAIKWIEAEKGVIVTNHSLAMLKTTKTIGGTRLLRANLLQPLKDIETINARLDCLDELLSSEELFFGLSQVLRKFPKETDRVLCHFCFKRKRVTNEVLGPPDSKKSQVMISSIILLKTALEALPLLCKVLKDAKSLLLRNIFDSINGNEKYASMKNRIEEVIEEDVLHTRVPFIARTQQCFAVKAGIDGMLDVARKSFCDTSEAIHNLVNKYREEFRLQNLGMPFNNKHGFYLRIPQKDIHGKLPDVFIKVLLFLLLDYHVLFADYFVVQLKVVKHGKNIHCSTLELESLNVRNKSASAECYMRTELCLEGLIDVIREDVSILTLLAEILCLLDMIVNSFAHTISVKPADRYSRPEFTEHGPLAIDGGRHPILDGVRNDFVPNNIFLSEASNMAIVMGPNMSGKSTYLQHVCLLVILAQTGCYVPARFVSIRVVDRIFTRMGTGDNLECNSSTFMTEMKETAFLLQNVTQRSLVVIDELGRATSSSDGFAVAWSCCEHLLSLKAYTIFATHMENLSELASLYPNVKILHFQVDVRNNHLDFKFNLKDGLQMVPHYGLLLAGVAGLPTSVVEEARSITSKISEREKKKIQVNFAHYKSLQMDYGVAQRLVCLKYSNQDEKAIRQALQDLKESYLKGVAID